jgi:hypothetical protein
LKNLIWSLDRSELYQGYSDYSEKIQYGIARQNRLKKCGFGGLSANLTQHKLQIKPVKGGWKIFLPLDKMDIMLIVAIVKRPKLNTRFRGKVVTDIYTKMFSLTRS